MQSASWFCCWLSCWTRLRSAAEVVPSTVLPVLQEPLTWKLRCSRNIWSCLICFAVFATVAAPRIALAKHDPLSKPLSLSFSFHWYCVFYALQLQQSPFGLDHEWLSKDQLSQHATIFTWFDQFETSRSVSFEFTVRTFKNISVSLLHFYFPLHYRLIDF